MKPLNYPAKPQHQFIAAPLTHNTHTNGPPIRTLTPGDTESRKTCERGGDSHHVLDIGVEPGRVLGRPACNVRFWEERCGLDCRRVDKDMHALRSICRGDIRREGTANAEDAIEICFDELPHALRLQEVIFERTGKR